MIATTEQLVAHYRQILDEHMQGLPFVNAALEGEAARWVNAFNEGRGPKLAVDIPSGLHGDTGEVLGVACRADVTVTFEAPKTGLVADAAAPWVGRLVVVPLGLPDGLPASGS